MVMYQHDLAEERLVNVAHARARF